jgi:predicted cupin superfamily sugar epimerase
VRVEELIERLGLEPLHGEGGHYRETWRADEAVSAGSLPARYVGPRAFGTAILYLLTHDPDSFSAIHRLPTDEVYHFYLGDPVELLELREGGGTVVVLGPDLAAGQRVQHVVPRGTWQGSSLLPGGRWALLGTTMAPGFEFADYEAGEREALLAGWPGHAERIRGLTRVVG